MSVSIEIVAGGYEGVNDRNFGGPSGNESLWWRLLPNGELFKGQTIRQRAGRNRPVLAISYQLSAISLV
ncbi:hypothetical protein ACLNGM_02580 [Aureimonas phyllosphaerae]|uniref:hypothetical protein n=1 Tax=Aureimonas phyllosphaerae TaxID=1166078 RepID=UPI003A5BC2D3